ncbi:hypothetical protein HBI56_122830 [Parastagonospora nodorum]|nr:hypothetical protein HBH56_051850 [Parastagonospora nodorum]KAH3935412.1 hypothetical protein HBH54_037640 [Parastagonospora nodorum]KAH3948486.1 hypothetical protein HBH53_101520 [Parastagonospora nodorum]KAH3970077.1 hypothetical protein HBH51_117610 [Parastagonospora nodorum]KAH3988826.1 hypothetical protein HBH52_026350 [Parastagonospora nodorum]
MKNRWTSDRRNAKHTGESYDLFVARRQCSLPPFFPQKRKTSQNTPRPFRPAANGDEVRWSLSGPAIPPSGPVLIGVG